MRSVADPAVGPWPSLRAHEKHDPGLPIVHDDVLVCRDLVRAHRGDPCDQQGHVRTILPRKWFSNDPRSERFKHLRWNKIVSVERLTRPGARHAGLVL